MGPCIIPELVEAGSRVSFLATLVRIGASVRSSSVRGPSLINNVENNFRCLEMCTHVQLHTHGNTYIHIYTPHSYTYKNVKWIKLLSRLFFFFFWIYRWVFSLCHISPVGFVVVSSEMKQSTFPGLLPLPLPPLLFVSVDPATWAVGAQQCAGKTWVNRPPWPFFLQQ